MFTGIIETIGAVQAIHRGAKSSSLEIAAKDFLGGTALGDSIAVNGVCLTVTKLLGGTSFYADAVAETLRQTNLGGLRAGSKVNLEKALTLSKPLGGHLVSGHVDGTGIISALRPEGEAVWISISTDKSLLRYILARGSVAVDGVSLTAARSEADHFAVSIIPHTAGHTTLLEKKAGDIVNIECDMIGKYVEKLLGLGSPQGMDEVFLKKHGF